MKIQELRQPSLRREANLILDQLWQQAQSEADQMINQYVKDVATNPHTPHPSHVVDQQLDDLIHAIE
jgi:hypothetical protein